MKRIDYLVIKNHWFFNDAYLQLHDYMVLTGYNNSGKSLFMREFFAKAISIYYKKESLPDIISAVKENKDSVIVIDGPVGSYIHPRALKQKIFGPLEDARMENNNLVIFKTYHPYLIDYFEMEDIFILEKNYGRTDIVRMDHTKLRNFSNDHSIGEIFYDCYETISTEGIYDKLSRSKKRRFRRELGMLAKEEMHSQYTAYKRLMLDVELITDRLDYRNEWQRGSTNE